MRARVAGAAWIVVSVGCAAGCSSSDTGGGGVSDTVAVSDAQVVGDTAFSDEDTVVQSDTSSQVDDATSLEDVTDASAIEDVSVAEDTTPVEPDEGGPVEPPPVVALPAGLIGQAANESLPPAFEGVLDQDGEPVLESQLVGHWTVIWFYPLASTVG